MELVVCQLTLNSIEQCLRNLRWQVWTPDSKKPQVLQPGDHFQSNRKITRQASGTHIGVGRCQLTHNSNKQCLKACNDMFEYQTPKSHKFHCQAATLNPIAKLLEGHQRHIRCWPCAYLHWIPLNSAWENFANTFEHQTPKSNLNFTVRRPFWIRSPNCLMGIGTHITTRWQFGVWSTFIGHPLDNICAKFHSHMSCGFRGDVKNVKSRF